jgi:hypothetical protein
MPGASLATESGRMKSFMNASLTRRAFISRVSLFTLGFDSATRFVLGVSPTVLNVGIVDGDDIDRIDGAVLGAEEARHAAALFGGDVRLTKISERGASSYSIVLGNADADRCARLAGSALLMNVASPSDALRGAQCMPMMFHVAASDAMLAGAGAGAAVWDSSLERFGADTLNQRFHSRFGRPMTPNAWSAWMAMKILWEASLRAKSADPRLLAQYLTRETTQFDGHKGRPLSFRAWDRQLRQPLYVKRGDRVVELPADDGSSPREALDRLGTSAAESSCKAL